MLIVQEMCLPGGDGQSGAHPCTMLRRYEPWLGQARIAKKVVLPLVFCVAASVRSRVADLRAAVVEAGEHKM